MPEFSKHPDEVSKFCETNGFMLHVSPEYDPNTQLPTGRMALMAKDAGSQRHQLMKCTAAAEGVQYLVDTRSGLIPSPTNGFVTTNLLALLNNQLQDEDSDTRRYSSLPITRTFGYFDISDFSTYPPGQQALILRSLITLMESARWNRGPHAHAGKHLVDRICIGDGYILVFDDAKWGAVYAALFAEMIQASVDGQQLPVSFHFRAGVHVGPVLCFRDPGRDNEWNYIGEGINGGQRILAAIGKDLDDVVFLSSNVHQRIHMDAKSASATTFDRALLAATSNRGRHKDKHGQHWRVYWLNHLNLLP